MKRREGGQPGGSSGAPPRTARGRTALGRVALGATLALAGDSMRRELAAGTAEEDHEPPLQADETRRTTKLPAPRFAAKTDAPAPVKAATQRQEKAALRAAAAQPAPVLAAEPVVPTPSLASAPSPSASVAIAEPEVPQRTDGVLAADFQKAVLDSSARSTIAKTPDPQGSAEQAKPETNLAQSGDPALPPKPAAEQQPTPSLPILSEQARIAIEPASQLAALTPATPVPEQGVPEQGVPEQGVPEPVKVAASSAPLEVQPQPHAPPEGPSAGPLLAAAQPINLQGETAPQSRPLPPTPAPPVVSKPAVSNLAASLPRPAFGGSAPALPPAAAPAPKMAPTQLAAMAPPAPRSVAPSVTAPNAAASAASAPSASGPAGPLPRLLAARRFPEARVALPQPAFGHPAPVQSNALTTSPVRASTGAAPGFGALGPIPVITEDDELILQIETQNGEMSDTVIAYGLRQGVYLPLGALTRFFDLPIAISDEGHYASGWFLDEKRTLALNLRDGTLVVAGRPVPFSPGDAVAYQGELYLRAERFGDLFPLDLKIDLRAQTIAVKTRELFPFEERVAREASRERLGNRSAKEPPPRFAREETPWRAFSLPMGETELRALTDDNLGSRLEADVRLAGDLAFMTARAYASVSTRDGLTAARLEMGRRDPDGDLLGPLKATEFQFGDVATAALPIGLRGITGRGAMITNAPLEQASIFDSVDLRGDLLDGYEVELYRNNTLIGSTRTPVNGQYAFLQVPVDFGLNVFRLVFYGPQGQRREVVRRVSVGDGRLAPGQFVYNVGAAQKDTNLFGVVGPLFSPAADFGAWRATAELGYGLSRAVTATLGAGFWQNGGRNHWLATTGLRSGIGATALRLDLGLQDGKGHVIGLGLGGKLLGMAYSLNHGEYGGGASDEVRAFTPDPLRRATELNLNTTLNFGSGQGARAMPLTSQIRHIEFADGRRQTDAALRASLPLGGVLLSNTMNFGIVAAPQSPTSRRLLGSFDLATISGSRTRFRAALGYAMLPRAEIQSAAFEVDRRFGESTLVRAGVNHVLDGHQTTLALSAVRRVGPVNVAFDGSYGFPTRNFTLALRVGFGFGRNPLSGRAFLGRQGLTSGGAVALRAFADDNANGRLDEGEAPLKGVTFLAGTEEQRSDSDGRAFLGHLGDGNRASIRVDADSMPDIALAPARPGVEIVPRPGRIHVSDFAVVTLSDIEGTAYFRGETGNRAVSRLQLRLLRADGTVAARTRSESDGFYLFERLPAGEYRLELDPQQAATLKIQLAEPMTYTLGGKSSVLRKSIYVKSTK